MTISKVLQSKLIDCGKITWDTTFQAYKKAPDVMQPGFLGKYLGLMVSRVLDGSFAL